MGTNEFTTKILPLKNNLFRVVFRITGDVEQSEQIVQEALLKVWEDRVAGLSLRTYLPIA